MAATSWAADLQNQNAVQELAPYQVRALQTNPTAMPDDSLVRGLYGDEPDVTSIPRAVAVISEQRLEDHGFTDLDDLSTLTAGAQRPNYLGIAGVPFLRGDDAGLYLEGIQRAYQLLAFPPSFNASDSLTLFKGNAPAHFGTTQAGGLLNQQLARPSLSSTSGEAALTVGSHEHYRARIDSSVQANDFTAYRIKADLQDSESWYRHVDDDRRSLYTAFTSELQPGVPITLAAQYYEYEGNENLGWNQLSQGLIDNSIYTFGGNSNKVDGKQVLVAPQDKASAEDTFIYMEVSNDLDAFSRIIGQVFVEHFNARKHEPSNGFAFNAEQRVIESKLTWFNHYYTDSGKVDVTLGTSIRRVDFEERFLFGDVTARNILTEVGSPSFGSGGTSNAQGRYYVPALYSVVAFPLSEKLTASTSLRAEAPRFSSGNGSGGRNLLNSAASLSYQVTETLTAYTTVQQSTALVPSEAGAVTSEANFAETELYEAGLKWHSPKHGLYSTVSFYYWDSSEFNTRAQTSESFRGHGVEWEAAYEPSERFYLTASAAAQRIYRRQGAPMRLMPAPTFFSAGGDIPANNPNMIVPGQPEIQAQAFAVWRFIEQAKIGAGPVWRDAFWTSYDRFYRVPESLVVDGFLEYEYKDWTARLDVENILDERYFTGTDPNFFGNALITQEPGRLWQFTLTRRF